jgi:hypothetical protein
VGGSPRSGRPGPAGPSSFQPWNDSNSRSLLRPVRPRLWASAPSRKSSPDGASHTVRSGGLPEPTSLPSGAPCLSGPARLGVERVDTFPLASTRSMRRHSIRCCRPRCIPKPPLDPASARGCRSHGYRAGPSAARLAKHAFSSDSRKLSQGAQLHDTWGRLGRLRAGTPRSAPQAPIAPPKRRREQEPATAARHVPQAEVLNRSTLPFGACSERRMPWRSHHVHGRRRRPCTSA